MIEYVKISNEFLETDDPYEQYYNHSKKYIRNKNKFVPFNKEIIQKRDGF